jgi:hypothetical protein
MIQASKNAGEKPCTTLDKTENKIDLLSALDKVFTLLESLVNDAAIETSKVKPISYLEGRDTLGNKSRGQVTYM